MGNSQDYSTSRRGVRLVVSLLLLLIPLVLVVKWLSSDKSILYISFASVAAFTGAVALLAPVYIKRRNRSGGMEYAEWKRMPTIKIPKGNHFSGKEEARINTEFRKSLIQYNGYIKAQRQAKKQEIRLNPRLRSPNWEIQAQTKRALEAESYKMRDLANELITFQPISLDLLKMEGNLRGAYQELVTSLPRGLISNTSAYFSAPYAHCLNFGNRNGLIFTPYYLIYYNRRKQHLHVYYYHLLGINYKNCSYTRPGYFNGREDVEVIHIMTGRPIPLRKDGKPDRRYKDRSSTKSTTYKYGTIDITCGSKSFKFQAGPPSKANKAFLRLQDYIDLYRNSYAPQIVDLHESI